MSLDARLLTALRGAGADAVSGVELSESLGVTRAAIWARIEELRRLGYEIEASPHRGYRLISAPDLLHADDLLARLGSTRVVGRDIRVFQETTSTNDVVEKFARDGVKEGVVVFAEAQTRGRGRLGRVWVSPARKGLWFSVLLRPPMRPQEATQITIAAGNALARAVKAQTRLPVEIKWPNDLLIRGRKAAGILTELHAELDQVKALILGIGVNVNQTARDFPAELRPLATSLRLEAGQLLDRAGLATAILRALDRDYRRVLDGEFDALVSEWEARCSTLGRRVAIQIGGRRVEGRAESLDSDGALLLRTQHGHLERIIGGDVTMAS
jgi:BirA family biotin operon repressor/biotin-[acetyl-CoA-carboxylase] ligase